MKDICIIGGLQWSVRSRARHRTAGKAGIVIKREVIINKMFVKWSFFSVVVIRVMLRDTVVIHVIRCKILSRAIFKKYYPVNFGMTDMIDVAIVTMQHLVLSTSQTATHGSSIVIFDEFLALLMRHLGKY